MAITAKGTFNGQELTDIPVLNPGGWFGKAWLLEIGGSHWPLFLMVEADTISDAIDELAENEKYGQEIVVAEEDLGEDSRHYSGSGQVLDLDHLMVHGPFPCRYFGDGLPEEGVVPTQFEPVEE